MSLITHLFNLLYPPRCPACGSLVARDGDWCPSCLAAVWHPRRINKPAAVRHLAACYCLADYRGAMRHILHDIKYNGKQGKCRACRVLLDRFPWPERFDRIDRVVPVPLAPEKLQRRGFNQAEALFRDWASVRWDWCDALQRLRPTKVQWQLCRDERKENVHDAFAVKETVPVQGKHILLVDDIFTTGATLEACAQALTKKGATSVTGLVIASGAP